MSDPGERDVPSIFEWDDWKAARNLKIHGVSFRQASQVFNDPWAMLQFDREIDGEERFHLTGTADGIALLVVVHTYRGDDEQQYIRIISARRATNREQRDYQKFLSSGATE